MFGWLVNLFNAIVSFFKPPPPPGPPGITSITPASGPKAGGTVVTLAGTNLDSVFGVICGGTGVSNSIVHGVNSLTFVTPPGAVGPADVEVISGFGTTVVVFAYV